MLLLALRIPTEYWVHLLTPFRGALPNTDLEYRQFIEYVRRFGHLAEAGNYSIAQGVNTGHPVMMTSDGNGSGYPDGTAPTDHPVGYPDGVGVTGGIGNMFPEPSGTCHSIRSG